MHRARLALAATLSLSAMTAFAETPPSAAETKTVRMTTIPAEFTTMSQAYVVSSALRADQNASNRPGTKTLYMLHRLLWIMPGTGMSAFFKLPRTQRKAFEAALAAPDMSPETRRQMREAFEPLDASWPKAAQLLTALVDAGMTSRAQAFKAAMALDARDDADFSALDAAFGSEEAFSEAISDYIARTPALTAWARKARSELEDRDRLDWLIVKIARLDEDARARLPEALTTIHAVSYFEGQISNGGIHQAFFNSSGDFAPEAAAGLRKLGRMAEADIVERGIAMFSTPYPRDTEQRRTTHFQPGGSAWDDRLAALGDGFDLDSIGPALIKFARREGLLPK